MSRANQDRIAGLLLAAGEGRRLGRPKALVTLDGETLLSRALAVPRAAGLWPVVVVLGAAADEVRATVDLDGITVVVNDAWRDGMGRSLRAGLAALDGLADAVAITLVDQPLVTAATVERLADAWRQGAVAAVATYDGRPANPVVLDGSIWTDVAAEAAGDVGARRWLRAHPEQVTPVACGDVGAPDDIDTPEDLARLRRTV